MPQINSGTTNPAELAAQKSTAEMQKCLDEGHSFRLEAGAGAGKTHSLKLAIEHIIEHQSRELQRRGQRVACITYTNVATAEITTRIDDNPLVLASTIHSFCWHLIRGFQSALRKHISELSQWAQRLQEAGGLGTRTIDYDLGHRHISDGSILLHHDDVIELTVMLMQYPKFRMLWTSRFPILLIDEYQDTNAGFADGLLRYFIDTAEGPLIGLFGDSWQKIYRNVSGLIEHRNLQLIKKGANFRSAKEIVTVLNKMRPDLTQEVSDSTRSGSALVFHSNNFNGSRLTGTHWGGDLPQDESHKYLQNLVEKLSDEGWDFSANNTKILMLTHRVLAFEQQYEDIASIYPFNDAYLKKEDAHIAFLIDTVEAMCNAYESKKYGEMFSILGSRSVNLSSYGDKKTWSDSMNALLAIRRTGTIGQLLDHLKVTRKPQIPEAVTRREELLAGSSADEIEESQVLRQVAALRQVPFSQLSALAAFVNEHTPFSTKHGVKGAQYEDVLVVFSRGWGQYNWDRYLKWVNVGVPSNKHTEFETNRNLFYVVCSRAKRRLVLLFTQELSQDGLATLERWFDSRNVNPLKLN